ncbi:T9SS type A sorting domain-containing protein [Pseudoflavitalea sp. X16]|uniref:T9SS type A sorting domain-containing protein n=1 Tax=Paraflavitalea devenefica TaxID=2716334 RepID=UPI001421B140|nr:T9SS type A sorting domain-containing protein [Paraflavitalea devenefica]NII23859.1 T9SS type A sorting domain-containing protein [Paraflavitalea devenefica]
MYPNLTPFLSRITMFLLVILFTATSLQAQVRFGNSYVNISKKTAGGTVQNGDTLEIRANFFFPQNYNSNIVYFVRYVDNIPTNTTYIGDSLRLITNEGLTYKRWTNAADTDPGTYLATPPAGQYNVRINIGRTATNPANNTATSSTGASYLRTGGSGQDKPYVGGGMLVTTAFRVRVTGNIGDTITLGAGQLRFKARNVSGDPDSIIQAIQYKILISDNIPICPNAVGRNFVAEAGGTFDSGTTQNRSYAPTFAIPNYNYSPLTYANNTGDGNYIVVNNLSPSASTFQDATKKPFCAAAATPPLAPAACENRMWQGHWDIIGDHTGSTTPAGNPPVAPGTRGGYMLVVNAAYPTSEAYRQFLTGLCPNTSYEFSLWVRNVCTNCGIDSNRVQTWRPGVNPNLTFVIDGLDRYSSGEIDTVGWMKKGFMFTTGPAQTSITISIRNNASGGGGNDWAIDDIALVTCNPDLNMLPGPSVAACVGQQIDIFSEVSSYFNSYVNWVWERSTNGGTTWSSTGTSGTGTPVYNGSAYEYTATYPSFVGTLADSGTLYRIKVASSLANLTNPDCSFSNNTIVVVRFSTCYVLNTKLLSFSGQLRNGYTALWWTTENEEAGAVFDVERSDDGTHFHKIGTVNARAAGMGATYNFTDPTAVSGTVLYRLKTIERSSHTYSRLVMVSNKPEPGIRSLVNPFTNKISFEIVSTEKGTAMITLTDALGRLVKHSRESFISGVNPVTLHGLEGFSKGMYTLRVQLKDKIINKQVLKLEQQ